LNHQVNQDLLNRISIKMNEKLQGLTITEISLEMVKQIKEIDVDSDEVVSKVIDVVYQTIQDADETDVFTYGTTNILKYPEFNDITKAASLIQALEEKDVLKDIVNTTIQSEDGHVKIVIGEENELEGLKECSLITTSYHIGGEKVGAIGIIGPKRMDYDKTVLNLRCLIKSVDELLNKL
ncbi:MAG: HrcA family transcriptional regulator, partial [Vallitaleaceae bacterium]|nr:HrcA family transcriptional regulator [Vallitaleaceae bacterium]